MAQPTFFFAIAAIFLSLSAFSATALKPSNHQKPAAAPISLHYAGKEKVPKHSQPPEPYPGFYAAVDKCLQKLSDRCGKEIFREILVNRDKEPKVNFPCCKELVPMGRRCHRKILKATLLWPEFSKRKIADIMNREEEIWTRCLLFWD